MANIKFGYLWSDLKFSAGKAYDSMVSRGYRLRINQNNSPLVFKNPRYKSVLVHAAKQLAMSQLEGEAHKLIPRFAKIEEKAQREKVLKQQASNYQTIIENQVSQSRKWGAVDAGNGHTIVAKDKYGNAVKEALMIYYTAEEKHKVKDVRYDNGKATETSYDTNVVCHIDLAPEVSMNSTKNVVMTQVQGRDYTRKELVSGGDLQFSVNGNIVSDQMGVYPVDAVRKFVQIMEYNGILDVNFMMFDTLNVKKIIIKDYSLGQQTYKNIQPYSFNCVAIEPDDEVKVQTDTISIYNKQLELSPMDKWYQVILNNKLAAMGASDTATSIATTIVGTSLDVLTKNI